MSNIVLSTVTVLIVLLCCSECTIRYYGGYFVYGTGDTFITTLHNHGGNTSPNRKWIIECLDGEAMVGVQDWMHDYERLQSVYCKFMFPRKPPTLGLYPYYPSCIVRNYTAQFFCYDATNHSASVNTFVTAIFDDEWLFQVQRIGTDISQPYKCCKTPEGYYVDYASCYYLATYDIFFEYMDAQAQVFIYCATGYVMTGISKKVSPYTSQWNVHWIQCCRIGYGPPVAHPPPISYTRNGAMIYNTGSYATTTPPEVPPSYRRQYRSAQTESGNSLNCPTTNGSDTQRLHSHSRRYQKVQFNDDPELMLHASPYRQSQVC